MGVYKALLNIGNTALGMKLDCGGHLTHGKNVHFSEKDCNIIVSYSISQKGKRIDYDEVEKTNCKKCPSIS